MKEHKFLKIFFSMLLGAFVLVPLLPVCSNFSNAAMAEAEDPSLYKTVRASHILVKTRPEAVKIKVIQA